MSDSETGILTDGLKYEFYADSDKPNMMDDAAFLRLDLAEVAKKGAIDDNTLEGVAAIRSGSFNPEDVGAEAKRKLLFESIVEIVQNFKSAPTDDFIRFILGKSTVGGKITKLTQKIVDANRDVVRSAMEAFVAREALARFGYSEKTLVRTPPERQEQLSHVTVSNALVEPEGPVFSPSEVEVSVFNYVKNRLYYLVRTEVLFREVHNITFRKTKTSFRVYYKRPTNGSLFDYKEHKADNASLHFPGLGGKDISYEFSTEVDDSLLKAFTLRVSEAGISLDSSPELRTIAGGQSSGAA
jgi:hypothetical protein